MKTPITPVDNLIHLQKNPDLPGIYDVDIDGIERLRVFDQIELHTVLYPYSRQITSDDIAFYPFEEYVKDVLSHQRSAYAEIRSPFNEIFGLSLGFVIALVFARFKPEELLSIESIVSVFGAYAIGKEVWDDVERAIVGLTKRSRLRLQDSYYRYHLEREATLTAYSYLAKRRRYGQSSFLPAKIDFIKQSNSQTLRMCFDAGDLESLGEPSAHIHSIHIEPELQGEFESAGFMFGVRLSLNKTFLGISRCLELFQSFEGGTVGCLDEDGAWVDDAVFYRRTLTFGRCKYYAQQGVIHGRTILSPELA